MAGKESAGRVGRLVLGAVAAAALAGCATQSRVDELETTVRSLQDRHERLQQELERSRSEAALLRAERDQLTQTVQEMRAQHQQQAQQLSQADERFRAFQRRLDQVRLGELNPEIEAAFAALAARHPDLVEYDPVRGMLRFNSDLTFDSGSAVVKPEASRTLASLAEILTSQAAFGYDVHVVGHTDSQPLSAATRQRHESNRALSCHRAIAVAQVLADRGVPPQHILTAGWGEYRPLVPNTPSGNTPQNRRVEIFLTATTAGGSGAQAEVPQRPVPTEPTK